MDASSEGRNRIIYRGNGMVSIPRLYEEGFSFELNARPRLDNMAVSLTYQLMHQEEQR